MRGDIAIAARWCGAGRRPVGVGLGRRHRTGGWRMERMEAKGWAPERAWDGRKRGAACGRCFSRDFCGVSKRR